MSENQQSSPNFAELVASLAALRPQQQQDQQGLAKHVGNGLALIVLAMGFWMATTISTLQNTLTQVSTTVTAINKTLGDVQASQGATVSEVSDLKAQNAALAQRVTTIETGIQRNADRMRLLEGQKPLGPLDGR